MGCWGFGIRESDNALDTQYNMCEAAGLSSEERPIQYRRPKLEHALPVLLEVAERSASETGQPDFDRAVAYQVLAALLMEAGCAFDETTRQRLVEGVRYCDEYVTAKAVLGNPQAEQAAGTAMVGRYRGRTQALDELAAQLQAYDIRGGTPVVIRARGLFDVLADRLASGEPGLLNQVDH